MFGDIRIYVICQKWPCWLGPGLAFNLPLVGVYFPGRWHQIFRVGAQSGGDCPFKEVDDFFLEVVSLLPRDSFILASGDAMFLKRLLSSPRIEDHEGGFLFAFDVHFNKWCEWDLHQ